MRMKAERTPGTPELMREARATALLLDLVFLLLWLALYSRLAAVMVPAMVPAAPAGHNICTLLGSPKRAPES